MFQIEYLKSSLSSYRECPKQLTC